MPPADLVLGAPQHRALQLQRGEAAAQVCVDFFADQPAGRACVDTLLHRLTAEPEGVDHEEQAPHEVHARIRHVVGLEVLVDPPRAQRREVPMQRAAASTSPRPNQ
ncbi:hypothetical protein BH23GEM9_BH23GEM9_19910 [soil metagenome]